MSIDLTMEGGYGTDSMDFHWKKDRSFTAHGGDHEWTLAPKFRTITIEDSGRSWAGTQNIGVIFSEACSGDATGWSCTINGVAKTLTYVSGTGTQNWVFQIGATLHHGDVIRLSYDQATGGTVSTTGSVEINALNAVQQPDLLTKRIRLILCDSTSTSTVPVPVASETVKAAICEYDSGTVANPNWMIQTNKASVLTDAEGQFDMLYTGTATVGGTVYVAVIRADENMIDEATVV